MSLPASSDILRAVQKRLGLNCVQLLGVNGDVVEVVFKGFKPRRVVIQGEATAEEIAALVASLLPARVYERLLVEDLANRLT